VKIFTLHKYVQLVNYVNEFNADLLYGIVGTYRPGHLWNIDWGRLQAREGGRSYLLAFELGNLQIQNFLFN